MARAIRAEAERRDPLGDDYLVEGEGPVQRPPTGLRIARGLQAILFVVLAILSLTLFWVVGLIFGVF